MNWLIENNVMNSISIGCIILTIGCYIWYRKLRMNIYMRNYLKILVSDIPLIVGGYLYEPTKENFIRCMSYELITVFGYVMEC